MKSLVLRPSTFASGFFASIRLDRFTPGGVPRRWSHSREDWMWTW
jgi:hypothetical protein